MSDLFYSRMPHHFHKLSYGFITVGSMEQIPGINKLFFGPSDCERLKHQSSYSVGPRDYIKERGLWFEAWDMVQSCT